jgi:predicted DNA-binding transcriptional regulator AlpA
MTVYLRFRDLKARGIVRNHTTLQRWICDRGFPPGTWLGPNSKAWSEDEIEAWLAAQPKGPRRKNGGGDAG